MQVILAAMGGGAPGTMTAECAGALAAAECVVGARRLLAALPAGCTARSSSSAERSASSSRRAKASSSGACGPSQAAIVKAPSRLRRYVCRYSAASSGCGLSALMKKRRICTGMRGSSRSSTFKIIG